MARNPQRRQAKAIRRKRLLAERRRLGAAGAKGSLERPHSEGEDADVEGAYDPAVAPDPAHWLALGEEERLDLALGYHRRAGIFPPSESMHAAIHVGIENQIALGDELPVRQAVDRLMGEGLDRHEAVHAVGSVLTDQLVEAMKDPEAKAISQEAYNAAIEQLTVERWLRDHANEDNED
jgi:Domain of unknown function (DUF1841)